jgi:hypothetical protein
MHEAEDDRLQRDSGYDASRCRMELALEKPTIL